MPFRTAAPLGSSPAAARLLGVIAVVVAKPAEEVAPLRGQGRAHAVLRGDLSPLTTSIATAILNFGG